VTRIVVVGSAPVIYVVLANGTGNYNSPTTAHIDLFESHVWGTRPRYNPPADDFDFVSSAAYFVPPRPRKGAYVALLPRLPIDPALETPPRSAPSVRQEGWRLAVHVKRVTTAL
jgi:hypothetical protein